MAIGTTLFAASIFEMPVHASADVFALCCQSPCLVRAIHFGGRGTNGFAGRIANERAQLALVDRLANEQFRLDEIVETELTQIKVNLRYRLGGFRGRKRRSCA